MTSRSVAAAGREMLDEHGAESMLMLCEGEPAEDELVAICGEYFVDVLVQLARAPHC